MVFFFFLSFLYSLCFGSWRSIYLSGDLPQLPPRPSLTERGDLFSRPSHPDLSPSLRPPPIRESGEGFLRLPPDPQSPIPNPVEAWYPTPYSPSLRRPPPTLIVRPPASSSPSPHRPSSPPHHPFPHPATTSLPLHPLPPPLAAPTPPPPPSLAIRCPLVRIALNYHS